MQRRFDGVLSQWNDGRGFGFITPSAGGEALFAHISAFPRLAQRPVVGLRVSFEIETGPNGKKRARGIRLLPLSGPETGPRPIDRRTRHRHGGRRLPLLFLLLGLGLAGWAYQRHATRAAVEPAEDLAPALQAWQAPTARHTPAQQPAQAVFSCDGRTHCSQMRSCAEAKFFLNHCPAVEMDGDSDGIPCEQQWCNSPLGN